MGRSPSPSSSKNSLDRQLERHRKEKKRERKLAKERAKELETPEQKHERRLAKKILKEEQKSSKGVLPESIPYTDSNNPFNDNNLTNVFVWEKKLEAEGKSKLSKRQIEKLNRERIVCNVAEMEELKRNRDARQAVKDDMEMISREQERSQYSDWRRTEDAFHLNQAKLRSQIRLKENRAKAIDLLSRYIKYGDSGEENDEEEFELKEPLSYLKGCACEDYEDLLQDIKVYCVLDGKKNDSFWDDIATIATSEIKKAMEQRRREETGDIHSAVVDDMLNVFKNKTYEELTTLCAQIQSKIANAGRGTDVGYWETTLQTLNPFMAKQRLKELHSKKLALRLKRIREEQSREMAKHEQDSGFAAPSLPSTSSAFDDMKITKFDINRKEKELEESTSFITIPFTISELEQCDDEMKEQKWNTLNPQQIDKFAMQLFTHGCYSPIYGDESQAMPGIEILSEEEDKKMLEEMRCQQKQGGGFNQAQTEEHIRMLAIAQQGMGKDETAFADEAAIEQQQFLWSDKYRPRKPRYFNRVHTGFDWNKYNQTHYDIDNPPPKIVQGYRFNIFYPDLLDVSETPSFKLIECEDRDFAILRFKCGSPYEDIAFKIVNREWEINHKHGYKCQFQNGVFQLWFFFKRYRYRR